MNNRKTEYKGRPIKCKCGKLIAYERDGAVYVQCRGCKHEHKIEIAKEPRA